MKMTVWVIEDNEFDLNESSVVGIYSSLAKAKKVLISIFEAKLQDTEDELRIAEDQEEFEELIEDEDEEEEFEDEDELIEFCVRRIKDLKETITMLQNPECYSIGTYFRALEYTFFEKEVEVE